MTSSSKKSRWTAMRAKASPTPPDPTTRMRMFELPWLTTLLGCGLARSGSRSGATVADQLARGHQDQRGQEHHRADHVDLHRRSSLSRAPDEHREGHRARARVE